MCETSAATARTNVVLISIKTSSYHTRHDYSYFKIIKISCLIHGQPWSWETMLVSTTGATPYTYKFCSKMCTRNWYDYAITKEISTIILSILKRVPCALLWASMQICSIHAVTNAWRVKNTICNIYPFLFRSGLSVWHIPKLYYQ